MLKQLSFLILIINGLFSCTTLTEKNNLYETNKFEAKVTLNNPAINYSKPKFCFPTCPTGMAKTNIEINHDDFILSYNIKTKYADWVAYKINLNNLSGPERGRVWKKDPKLPPTIALAPKDYKDAYITCNYDRGHQAPLADFSNNTEWKKLNYLSNITPQKSQLNRGVWYRLESKIRSFAKKTNGDMYVLTGTYYNNNEEMCKLPNSSLPNIVPNGYWKIVMLLDKQNIYRVSFLFDQNIPSKANHCHHISSVRTIAKLTNLKLDLSDNFDNSPYLLKQLGCN